MWGYFWPVLAVGLVLGAVTGVVAVRRKAKRNAVLALGLLATLLLASVWHGPLGAGQRLSSEIEHSAKQTLAEFEMAKVTAHLHHGPLTRRLILAGPADDFQTTELVRIMSSLPGVSVAQWTEKPGGLPLIVEGLAAAAVGFLCGLLLAYLFNLHRRHNAQWNW